MLERDDERRDHQENGAELLNERHELPAHLGPGHPRPVCLQELVQGPVGDYGEDGDVHHEKQTGGDDADPVVQWEAPDGQVQAGAVDEEHGGSGDPLKDPVVEIRLREGAKARADLGQQLLRQLGEEVESADDDGGDECLFAPEEKEGIHLVGRQVVQDAIHQRPS